jgi:hypothetical protein
MLWLYLILSGFVLVILYVLFAKICLEINSITDVYQLSFRGLASVAIISKEDNLVLKLKIFVWRKYFNLLDLPKNVSKESPETKVKIRKELPINKLWFVLKSFKIKRCELNLDLGNNQWNGILFPVFYVLETKYNRPLRINFLNENSIVLKIENNLARILWVFITN